ncbi:MAG: hypothetical protein A3F31_01795 [Candidatus Levybacteria bacterium RIFCSPHIGHO2_12_FULL_38_12]|nr:MAG: hypothetical protein A2770_03255 [Candidatus Levybacteria bacterium RIFCSPHIGHO2_01_FULL_38_12]OGH22209.1 MAG: hypothetical protein A3F31_01795 [Candidatus Levybacteria bacterium RIFCSPHIGHO2_12_FULL_38_12]OGH34373.1 MAG: hypothetical protein A3A47_02155 [Candidatus Levybacteria bacterium RIFCSPLOWO2_01_FULL_37_20]OGH44255.1 MAG: hypothetical protein A3J14_01740 [Candidatus Levybacteria bacterium RIFCSPLOWO2_02_FULL_37_18]
MGSFITTNIRIPEEDYIRLKEEALKTRKSLASIIRAKITKAHTEKSPEDIFKTIRKHALGNRSSLQDIDTVKTVREMRDGAKW